MTRTYVFGCHEQIEALKTFSVNVPMHGAFNPEAAKQTAFNEAAKAADGQGLPQPYLLFESGIPDIRIILEGGRVTSVYYRNSDLQPVISVTDIDMCGEEMVTSLKEYGEATQRAGERVLRELQTGGFTLAPHFEEQ